MKELFQVKLYVRPKEGPKRETETQVSANLYQTVKVSYVYLFSGLPETWKPIKFESHEFSGKNSC